MPPRPPAPAWIDLRSSFSKIQNSFERFFAKQPNLGKRPVTEGPLGTPEVLHTAREIGVSPGQGSINQTLHKTQEWLLQRYMTKLLRSNQQKFHRTILIDILTMDSLPTQLSKFRNQKIQCTCLKKKQQSQTTRIIDREALALMSIKEAWSVLNQLSSTYMNLLVKTLNIGYKGLNSTLTLPGHLWSKGLNLMSHI